LNGFYFSLISYFEEAVRYNKRKEIGAIKQGNFIIWHLLIRICAVEVNSGGGDDRHTKDTHIAWKQKCILPFEDNA